MPRRSTRSIAAASTPKCQKDKISATKKAIKKASGTASIHSSDSGVGDDLSEDNSHLYDSHSVDLTAKNDRMVRDIECIFHKGPSAVPTKSGYTQTIELVSVKPFSLKPVLMKSGPYAGCHVLVPQPEPTQNEMFPFLELPAEIRNMIYSHVLERPNCIVHIFGKQSGTIKSFWTPRTAPYSSALIRVNKQISVESSPYLFSRHRIDFSDSTMMHRFLEHIGPERVKSLVSISLGKQYRTLMKKAFKMLAPATALTTFDMSNPYWGPATFMHDADWLNILIPLIQAMCHEGRSRADAVGILKMSTWCREWCDEHGMFRSNTMERCEKAKKSHDDFWKKVHENIFKALDDAEAKKKAIKKGIPSKTRAGRSTKTINYADDGSDDDYE